MTINEQRRSLKEFLTMSYYLIHIVLLIFGVCIDLTTAHSELSKYKIYAF